MTLPASSTKSSELARIAAEAAGTRSSSVQFTLTLEQAWNYITGTAANNTLTGTANRDYISGLGGDDIIIPGAGTDYLDGGTESATETKHGTPPPPRG